jgi:hypothetical protein
MVHGTFTCCVAVTILKYILYKMLVCALLQCSSHLKVISEDAFLNCDGIKYIYILTKVNMFEHFKT